MAIKRKLHINWDSDKQVWLVKKSFGFLSPQGSFTTDELRTFLLDNNDVEVIAKYF